MGREVLRAQTLLDAIRLGAAKVNSAISNLQDEQQLVSVFKCRNSMPFLVGTVATHGLVHCHYHKLVRDVPTNTESRGRSPTCGECEMQQ